MDQSNQNTATSSPSAAAPEASSSRTSRRRMRPQSRLASAAAIATAALALSCCGGCGGGGYPSSAFSSAHAAHTGLRGLRHKRLDHPRLRQFDDSSPRRSSPQHGNQRPRRPIQSAMLPPHDWRGRRLSPDEETSERDQQQLTTISLHEEWRRDLVDRRGRKPHKGNKSRAKKKEKGTEGDSGNGGRGNGRGGAAKRQEKQQQNKRNGGTGKKNRGDSDEKDKDRDNKNDKKNSEEDMKKIKEENDKRHEENKKLKNKLEMKQIKLQLKQQKQQQKKYKKDKKDKDDDDDDAKDKKDMVNNDKDDEKDKKDKGDKKDKKDKGDKKDKKGNDDKEDKKDKDDQTDKKDKGDKKGKGDKKDKNEEDITGMSDMMGFGNIINDKNDNDDDKKDKYKPDKNGGKNPDKKPNENINKPNQKEEPLSFEAQLQNAGIDPQEAALMTEQEKEEFSELTDGKYDLSGYKPPDKPKPQPSASNTVSAPQPPKPTPKPAKPPTTLDIGDANFFSSGAGGTYSDGKFNFVSSLSDTSTQLDGFEKNSGLQWSMPPIDPWSASTTYAYEGTKSISSGITRSTYSQAGSDPIYSKLTLTTDNDFKGGVLTFKVKANTLKLPTEAFYVEVDGKVELPPVVTAAGSSSEWAEYSVPARSGMREVTFVHVYNPFGLESLPAADGSGAGLWMDDVRYAPYTTDLSDVQMANGGDAKWQVDNGGRTAVALTDDIPGSSGNADIQFVLFSQNGGSLKYRVQTETTAPHDDFAILLNGREHEAIFGEMVGYESRILELPPGKQVVTLRHRKNPGGLSRSLLDGLGSIGTEGQTWVEDLSFEANWD